MAPQQELQPCATTDHLIQLQPSSSSSPPEIYPSSSSTPNTQPSPPMIPINARHYAMLLKNKARDIWDEIDQGSDFATLVWKPDNSTILHLAASMGQGLLINMFCQRSPHLLHLANSKGDLPIHVAVRACQFEAVRTLVLHDDQLDELSMLDKENCDKNTPLHVALQNQQKDMATYLFQKYPKTFYHLNKQGISPLYLAMKAEFWELVSDMLSRRVVTEFPEAVTQLLEGRSVVHAAIDAKKKDILNLIFEGYYQLLCEKTDEIGRMPLSYAAYIGFLDGLEYINEKLPNQAFKIDETGLFPIHWACRGGDIKILEFFFDRLPEKTRLMLTGKGQNLLHVAASTGQTQVVKYLLRKHELETMINMKDEDGNTPLHLASKRKHPNVVYDLTWDVRVNLTLQNNNGFTALDIAEDYGDKVPSFEERLTWLSLRCAGVSRAPQVRTVNVDIIEPEDIQASHIPVNAHPHDNNHITPPTNFMVLGPQKGLIRLKRKNKYKERINTLLLVASLVTTVTYASGFSIPGGYRNNDPAAGMATLAREGFFQVFVISNTIAMYSAILAAVTLIWAQLDDQRLILLSLDFALPFLGIAIAMMSVAFMAGLYLVLHTMVFWLGIVVLVLGGTFLLALMVFFVPLFSPISCYRIKILRHVLHYPFKFMLWACAKGKSEKQY